jgi:glycosyltransferase involved in cell wall biosynthesis
MKISVVMNTFNRAHLLRLALRSYLRQTEGDFEVVVADDGSTDETPAVVEEFQKIATFDVTYARHEHAGHRRAAAVNLGIAHCRYAQILFTDCDSLGMSNLVEAHRRHARSDRMLCGGYIRLEQDETERLTEEDVTSGRFEALLDARARRQLLRKHLKARWEIIRRKPRRPHNMGLNFSVSRDALYRINGYDEEFEGWGSEDGDVRERLRSIGVHPYSLYDKAVVLHMWHPVEPTKLDKDNLRRNRQYARRLDAPVFCRRGLRQSDDISRDDDGSPT